MSMQKLTKLLINSKNIKTKLINVLVLAKLQRNNKSIVIYFTVLVMFVGATVIYLSRISSERKYADRIMKAPAAKTVTALGRIEPEGKVIRLTVAPDLGKVKISQLLATEGDRVIKGQTIALLDSYQHANTAVQSANQKVKVAQAKLVTIKAGSRQENISANAVNLKQLEEEVSANEAKVAQLKAQLSTEQAQMQAVIDRRQTELRNAKSEFRRYQQLAQDGVISRTELDYPRLTLNRRQNSSFEAKSSYNFTIRTLEQQIDQAQAIARKNKNALQEQMIEAETTSDSMEERREVDIVKAQAEVDREQTVLKQAEEDLELTHIEAPSDGQITKINAYPGETVGKDGVVELTETEAMMVVAEVNESDIDKVKVGQTANIRSATAAFAGQIIGEVNQIGSKVGKQDVPIINPATDIDSKVLEVEIHLDPKTRDRLSHLTNSKVIVEIK